MVAGGLFGVGQRGSLGPDAVPGSTGVGTGPPARRRPLTLAGLARTGFGRLSGLGRAIRAVHPGILQALGQPPADDGHRDEDGRDHPDERLARP